MLADFAQLLGQSTALYAGLVFVLGLLIGSFLNVVAYRLPIMMDREWRSQAADVLGQGGTAKAAAPTFNLITPRSACPSCNAPIPARHNLPLVSWLLLRGRCASCQARISPRYPIIEFLTGALSAVTAWHFGLTIAAVCAAFVTWTLIALTVIDIDHQLLPDSLTLLLLWVGLVAAAAFGPWANDVSFIVAPRDAIWGAALGYLSLWAVYHGFRLLTGKEGMGYGDFKLLAALGAWVGWKLLPMVIVLAAGAGAVFGIFMILFRGRDRAAPMPFGPYLAVAGWLAMLYGDRLWQGYLRVSGLRH